MNGNCRIRDITVSDIDLAKASKHLIITCERLITNEEIRREPTLTVIPFFCVDAVCEVSYGAYPGVMAYEYFSDEEHIREWLTVENDPEAFKEFLDKNIYNVESHFDYITTPGYLEGGDSRDKSGLPKGSGPYRVITNIAVMDFEPESKRMRILSINPGYSEKDVQDSCGFELLKAKKIKDTNPPTKRELQALREEVDPSRYVIGR